MISQNWKNREQKAQTMPRMYRQEKRLNRACVSYYSDVAACYLARRFYDL